MLKNFWPKKKHEKVLLIVGGGMTFIMCIALVGVIIKNNSDSTSTYKDTSKNTDPRKYTSVDASNNEARMKLISKYKYLEVDELIKERF